MTGALTRTQLPEFFTLLLEKPLYSSSIRQLALGFSRVTAVEG